MGPVYVGTSGWVYPHWRRIVYPEGLPPRRWLEHYATLFATVELNNTFYRLPEPKAVEGWRRGSPPGFVFACKGSRFLTHMKRLTDTGAGVDRFYQRVDLLGEKRGPILWQLPPTWKIPDPARLDAFLAAQPRRIRQVVEFRHEAWYRDDVLEVLDRHGAALCEHDLVERRTPRPTGSFRYLRFHGKTGPYRGRYGARFLAKVARDLVAWGGEAYVYFNNDAHGHAVRDALDLLSALGPAAYPLFHGEAAPEEAPEAHARSRPQGSRRWRRGERAGAAAGTAPTRRGRGGGARRVRSSA